MYLHVLLAGYSWFLWQLLFLGFILTEVDFLVQIDLMISGNGPVSAVTYLSDLKLFRVVFAFPSSSEPSPSENCGRFISFLLLLTHGKLANLVLWHCYSYFAKITHMSRYLSLCQSYLEAMWGLIQTPGLGKFSVSSVAIASCWIAKDWVTEFPYLF